MVALLTCTASLTRSMTRTCPLLSLVPTIEPVPLPDRGEEQRSGEDSSGERGWGVEGLLWWRISGDSGWVRHEIRSGVHLSGYDVSSTLIYGLFLHQSVTVLFSKVKERRRQGRRAEKWSSSEDAPLSRIRAFRTIEPLFDWLITGLVKRLQTWLGHIDHGYS